MIGNFMSEIHKKSQDLCFFFRFSFLFLLLFPFQFGIATFHCDFDFISSFVLVVVLLFNGRARIFNLCSCFVFFLVRPFEIDSKYRFIGRYMLHFLSRPPSLSHCFAKQMRIRAHKSNQFNQYRFQSLTMNRFQYIFKTRTKSYGTDIIYWCRCRFYQWAVNSASARASEQCVWITRWISYSRTLQMQTYTQVDCFFRPVRISFFTWALK